jgi:tetratricopeptide (TPR) repeat protein
LRAGWACAWLLLAAGCGNDVADALCESGTKLAREGRHEEALPVIASCLGQTGLSDMTRAHALQSRAWSHSNLSQHEPALADQEAAFKLRPAKDHREFINYAVYLRNAGRHEQSLYAVLSAERAEGGSRPSMMTQYHKGWSLSELGRHKEAVEAFTEGIPQQPDYAYVYWRRGLAHEALGNKELAARDFERCAQLLIDKRELADAGEVLPALRKKLAQYGLANRFSL